ncbi:MAG: hypothetical protein PHU91_04000 [Candidatus Omnitrophica bacterium]|nr:hypothetical protein [Candidatus Omnitrophota bacterium]MDD5236803.1 hypothetical protein [Candidatus Omnitrophota bacterium]MDD5610955.1 hypothetical protein [Candidatus Omnitrophota bacterium]
MMTISRFKKILFASGAALSLLFFSEVAFARDHGRGDYHGRSGREVVIYRGERFHYHEGRFYRPSFFGFDFNFVIPPVGVVVTYLPFGYRTVIIGGARYYEYDNVYYQPCPGGYIVVQEPVRANEYISPNVIYAPAPSAVLPQGPKVNPLERETVTINVPAASGTNIAITLVRYPTGFVGPQGEFYATLPTAEELRARYGK